MEPSPSSVTMGSKFIVKHHLFPQQYVSESGEKVITHDDILHGQTAWQTTGGMQVGSVWGHGAYQAPDWTADWLHRELTNCRYHCK